MDRCPICNVSVKPENLVRHLNDIHPRHPDTARLRDELKAEVGRAGPKRTPAPIHVPWWLVALVALVIVGGVGAYYLTQTNFQPFFQPFPCVPGTAYVYHWHTQLNVFSGSAPYPIPANVGISGSCLEPVHTHDTSGLIHIETTVNRLYSVGDFYLVWGKSFGSPSQMIVNGTALPSPTPSQILYDQETISIYYASFT